MSALQSVVAQDTGTLEPVVKAAGWLVSAAAAIGLGWRGRANWEPAEEDVGRGPAKVSSLIAAVGLALIWSQLGNDDHRTTLVTITIVFAVLCLASLLSYGYLIGTKLFTKELATGPGTSESVKIVGGFRLTPQATKVHRDRPELTIQEILMGAAYDPDKVWTINSRALAKQTFVVGYLGLTVFGTLALSAAAILLIL